MSDFNKPTGLPDAFNYEGPSLWNTDKQLKRYKQGAEFTKKKQDKEGINVLNQVFFYSKALLRKSNGSN